MTCLRHLYDKYFVHRGGEKFKKQPKLAYLGVWNALNPHSNSCVCMMSDINCAKRVTSTMRCAFHSPNLGLSNAVPIIEIGLLFLHLVRVKLRSLRNFWPQISPPFATFSNFREFGAKPTPKPVPCSAAITECVRLKTSTLSFKMVCQRHAHDSWFRSYAGFKYYFHLRIHPISLLFKAKWHKIANHEQKKSRMKFFGLPQVLNHRS